jgi:hypothetical protein
MARSFCGNSRGALNSVKDAYLRLTGEALLVWMIIPAETPFAPEFTENPGSRSLPGDITRRGKYDLKQNK